MTYTPAFSDEAVRNKTGHGWSHWFRRLDAWGAKTKRHTEIARHLRETLGLDGWWSQMVAGEYEKSRGLRAPVGQQSDSDRFDTSVQRTVTADPDRVWQAVATSRGLRAWMGEGAYIGPRAGGVADFPGLGEATVRLVDRGRRLRLAFKGRGAGRSTLEITVNRKSDDKCTVRVHHTGLESAQAFERYKKRWTRQLDALKAHLAP